jgi:hypothetical protein
VKLKKNQILFIKKDKLNTIAYYLIIYLKNCIKKS